MEVNFLLSLYGFWGSKSLYVKLSYLTAPPEGILDDIISPYYAISVSHHQEMSLFLFILMIIHQGTLFFKHDVAWFVMSCLHKFFIVLTSLDICFLLFLLVLHVTLLLHPTSLSVFVLINIS